MNTIGSRIAENRRRIGMTQEELAAKLAVSAQAVSKWENDITCPDVMTLPKLAELLGITVDELLSGKKQPQTLVLADEERKNVDDMMLKIIVNSHEGDKVKVNLTPGYTKPNAYTRTPKNLHATAPPLVALSCKFSKSPVANVKPLFGLNRRYICRR